MGSVNFSTYNLYFDYAPIWTSGHDPLPLKVANAALATLINLAALFANACIGLGDLINSFFSSHSISYANPVRVHKNPLTIRLRINALQLQHPVRQSPLHLPTKNFIRLPPLRPGILLGVLIQGNSSIFS